MHFFAEDCFVRTSVLNEGYDGMHSESRSDGLSLGRRFNAG